MLYAVSVVEEFVEQVMPPRSPTRQPSNPLAVAIPAGTEPPLVLDMATTVVSFGTAKRSGVRGETLKPGWVIGPDGEPTTDPERAHHGSLPPIGDYKGSGLALVIGLPAGVLNGAAFGRDVVDLTTDGRSRGSSMGSPPVLGVRPLRERRQDRAAGGG